MIWWLPFLLPEPLARVVTSPRAPWLVCGSLDRQGAEGAFRDAFARRSSRLGRWLDTAAGTLTWEIRSGDEPGVLTAVCTGGRVMRVGRRRVPPVGKISNPSRR
jgi:hypothetical protein